MRAGGRWRQEKKIWRDSCPLVIHPPRRQTEKEREIKTEEESVMMWLIAAGCERFTKLPPTVFFPTSNKHQTINL